jgi:hypothetical protein
LSIGLQGTGLGEASYQSAVAYAKDRLQGRAADGVKNAGANADPIIHHGDVRRMLMTMRALNEGGRALAAYLGLQLDTAKFGEDAAVKAKAEDRVALLTPVAKAFFTDRGLETCVIGQQVFGGHGYIREWGMEQFVRDARIAQIYEGTNGIQALDLAGRKVARNGGKSVQAFLTDAREWLTANRQTAAIGTQLDQLAEALDLLESLTGELLAQAGRDPNAISASACEYLDVFGYVVYAWLWARMMAVAATQADQPLQATKLITGRFYFERLLPKARALAEQMRAGSDTMMALSAEAF